MKQQRIKKCNFFLLMLIFCAVSVVYTGRTEADAATDVTRTVQGKQDIRILAESFATLCGVDLIYRMEIGQKKKYDFSEPSIRRYAISYSKNEWNSQISAGIDEKTLSRRIFGKSTTKVNFIEGDWGLGYPKIKIKKIYKLDSGKYTIKADVDWIVENEYYEIEDSYQIGELQINFKKKPKSYYGYIVKSMVLKKVSD